MSYVRTHCSAGPAARTRERLDLARTRFHEFHGRCGPMVVRAPCARVIPKVLVQLGTLRAVVYTADRGDGGAKQYIHFMEREPLLTCNPEGTQLYIVGGRYRVTRRGIEG